MKRIIAAALFLLVCMPVFAMQNLSETALIGDSLIYYAGSLDGTTPGLFVMGPEGENPRMIREGEPLLLAGCEESVLINEYGADGSEQTILLSPSGEVLYTLSTPVFGALEHDGVYYAGNCRIANEESGYTSKEYAAAASGDQWAIDPLHVEGSTLYYEDSTLYAQSRIEYGQHVGKLMKVSLDTLAVSQVSPEGTHFLGIWDGRAVYVRQDFYIYTPDDDVEMIDAGAGLYLEGTDGSPETKLASIEEKENGFLNYVLLADGVVYGEEADYSTDEPQCELLCVDLATGNVSRQDAPYADIVGKKDAALYLCASDFVINADGEYVQTDHLIAMDPLTDDRRNVNEGRSETLYYSEGVPEFVFSQDHVYYLDFDLPRCAIRLCMSGLDGTGHQILAQGRTWADEEF